MQQLWHKVSTFIPKQRARPESDILPPIYKVQLLETNQEPFSKLSAIPAPLGAVSSSVYLSKAVINRRITSKDHFQDTRHLELELLRPDLRYDPGDIIMIQPKNDENLIKDFIARLGLTPNQVLKITIDLDQVNQVDQSSLLHFPPDGITLLELFCYWINLMEPPNRYFMQVLSKYV